MGRGQKLGNRSGARYTPSAKKGAASTGTKGDLTKTSMGSGRKRTFRLGREGHQNKKNGQDSQHMVGQTQKAIAGRGLVGGH